jgi:curved DNA-binding protein CbpA
VTDYFSLLNEPRRPWLDADRLRQKFLLLAAEFHPDRTHNAAETEKAVAHRNYAELNAAYHCLAEPKSRLLHLLELERGAKPADIQTIPPTLADLFAGIAAICREADAFMLERDKVSSPLLKIQWFERAHEWIERLNSWQKKLADLRGELTARLESLDADWLRAEDSPPQKAPTLLKLEELYRLFGYFNRWQGQLQERVVRLSF